MEAVFALIYILLNVMPSDAKSFTLGAAPDTALYGERQENGTWRVETGEEDAKTYFGDFHVENRQLIIKTGEGEISFEAADALVLAEHTDWKALRTFGQEPVVYEMRRSDGRIEFFFTIQGANHTQSAVATFKP